MAKDKTTEQKHESYGMIAVSRFQGGAGIFFGSSIKHGGGVAITIRRASVERHLNHDWYNAHDEVIEVNMSYNQYAEMISTPNTGFGVPCTIRHINRERMEAPPFESKAEEHRKEFKESLEELSGEGTLYMKEAMDILENKSTISKADRAIISNAIAQYKQHIESNLPFVQNAFQEQMDKTIVEAKAEIEGFVEAKIRATGLESLRKELPQLGEAPNAEPKRIN